MAITRRRRLLSLITLGLIRFRRVRMKCVVASDSSESITAMPFITAVLFRYFLLANFRLNKAPARRCLFSLDLFADGL